MAKAHENRLNITCFQENSHQNQTDISLRIGLAISKQKFEKMRSLEEGEI